MKRDTSGCFDLLKDTVNTQYKASWGEPRGAQFNSEYVVEQKKSECNLFFGTWSGIPIKVASGRT